MPTVELDKKRFLEALDQDVDDEKLEHEISMLGTDVESIGSRKIKVEAFPDRPDFLYEEGVAKNLKGILGKEKGLKEYKVHESSFEAVDEKPEARPVAGAAVIKDLQVNQDLLKSLMQLQEKIHVTHGRKRKEAAIGVHNLDPIDFPVKYTEIEKDRSFHPLQATEEMTAEQVLEEHPKGKKFAHLMEGYDKFPAWIDDSDMLLSFPPIINGKQTELSPGNNEFFVDVTGYEEGTVMQTLNLVVTAMADMGGEIHGISMGGRTLPDTSPEKMKLDRSYVNDLLGLEMSEEEMKDNLRKMRFGIEEDDVLVPCYRTDVLHQIDLVEDIAIAHGYENVQPRIPELGGSGSECRSTVFKRKTIEALVSLGLVECKNYHLTDEKTLVENMERSQPPLAKAKNPVNENYDTLRDMIFPGLMEVLSENTHYDYPQEVFEVGRAIEREDNSLKEIQKLSCALCGPKEDFTEIKSLLNSFFMQLGPDYELERTEKPFLIDGRAAEVVVNGKKIGWMGEVSPKVLVNFGVSHPVSGMELVLSGLEEQ